MAVLTVFMTSRPRWPGVACHHARTPRAVQDRPARQARGGLLRVDRPWPGAGERGAAGASGNLGCRHDRPGAAPNRVTGVQMGVWPARRSPTPESAEMSASSARISMYEMEYSLKFS
jgi:hypothetical protein